MVELASDQIGGRMRPIVGNKGATRRNLKSKFNWEDTHHLIPGCLKYNWGNRRAFRHVPNVSHDTSTGRILRRIDRCYAPIPTTRSKFTVSSSILPGICLSDHAPVLIQCTTPGETHKPSAYRMNVSDLKHPTLTDKITAMWQEETLQHQGQDIQDDAFMISCLTKAKQIARTWGKQRAAEKQRKEKELCQKFADAQRALQDDPQNTHVQQAYHNTKLALDQLDEDRAKWVNKVLQTSWL